jgi:opacity protein-like surface antigen
MRILTGLAILAALTPAQPAAAQELYSENQIGVFGGMWLGDNFASETIPIVDALLGPIEYITSLKQGNAPIIGIQYTGYFPKYLGADVVIGYASGEWTTESGRLNNGSVDGETNVLTGIATVPMALNALIRIPTGGSLPSPFITAGLGGVFYEFSRSDAPIRTLPVAGTPIDTVLFDLKLGLRLAPNVGGGLLYNLTDRIAVRAEGRMWFTLITEVIENELINQKNKWFLVSAVWRL